MYGAKSPRENGQSAKTMLIDKRKRWIRMGERERERERDRQHRQDVLEYGRGLYVCPWYVLIGRV